PVSSSPSLPASLRPSYGFPPPSLHSSSLRIGTTDQCTSTTLVRQRAVSLSDEQSTLSPSAVRGHQVPHARLALSALKVPVVVLPLELPVDLRPGVGQRERGTQPHLADAVALCSVHEERGAKGKTRCLGFRSVGEEAE